MLQTFRQLRIQHQPPIEEDKFSPCKPTRPQELPPTHYQPTITEILPPHNADDTQHHI